MVFDPLLEYASTTYQKSFIEEKETKKGISHISIDNPFPSKSSYHLKSAFLKFPRMTIWLCAIRP